jgi:hypothetical protein
MAFAVERVENVVLGGVIGLAFVFGVHGLTLIRQRGRQRDSSPIADSKDVVAARLLELCNSAKPNRVVRPYRPLSNACSKASASGPVSQQVRSNYAESDRRGRKDIQEGCRRLQVLEKACLEAGR